MKSINKNVVLTILIILLNFNFVQANNENNDLNGYVSFTNDQENENWVWTLNVEKSFFTENFKVGTTLKTHGPNKFVNKFPIGFSPRALNYDIYGQYSFKNIDLMFNSICHHYFSQSPENDHSDDWQKVNFTVKYNFN